MSYTHSRRLVQISLSIPSSPPTGARFDQFQVDLTSGELMRSGVRVPIQGHPFQVLRLLLEAEGKVVTREELRQVLWPEDTFVDFELGVNTAVKKLRQALEDSADHPKFIETLPRYGYRFMIPVEWMTGNGDKISPPSAVQPTGHLDHHPNWLKIAVGSVILLIASGLLFSPMPATGSRLFTHQSQPQPLEAVPLTALPGQEISPSFSPDGSQVAFGWDGETNGAGFDLYVKVIGTDKPLRLTNHPAPWLGVAWSPDGRSISPYTGWPQRTRVFSWFRPWADRNENSLPRITSALWAPDAALSWSPDGKQLAFADHSPLVGYSTQIFLLSLDTLERKRMETGCDWTFGPGFSPLGDSLAYLCLRDDGDFSLNLLDLREGKNKRLFAGLLRIRDPTWTRDGARIIFSYGSGFTSFRRRRREPVADHARTD